MAADGDHAPPPVRFAEAPTKRTRWLAAVVCALLVLAVAMVFGRSIAYDFVYDDFQYLHQSPQVARGLCTEGIVWAFTTTQCSNWHPFTWLSYMLDAQLYGLKPWGYRLTNILLHAATAILLFLVLRQMTSDLWPSAFVAAVFAIHPLRAESVVWVAERKDVLSGLFFMLTLAAYAGYVRRPFSLARYSAVVVLFALGLMAKPMLVTLPLVLLLLDYWPLGRMGVPAAVNPTDSWGGSCTANPGVTVQLSPQRKRPLDRATRWWRLVLEKLPLLALSAASCVATSLAQQGTLAPFDQLPLGPRAANAVVSYATYLRQFFYPAGLAVYYPHPEDSLLPGQIVGALLLLAVITAAVVVCWRRCPWLPVGWFWYLGMLVPAIGLVQVGHQAMADRYTYLPQIGLAIGLAWTAKRALESWPYRGWLYGVTGALAVAGLMGCAWHQTSFWHDSTTLWRRAIDCTSHNARAHANLGSALAAEGKTDEAIIQYTKALEVRPDLAEVSYNLGVALAGRGRIDEAIARYEQAVKFKPNYMPAYHTLGHALLDRGRVDEAIAQFRKALAAKPDYAEAHNNLGLALLRSGRRDEAVVHFRKALELQAEFVEARNNLAIALGQEGAAK